MLNGYVKKILEARVYDVALETPIQDAPFISKRLDNRVVLKREDLQPVFSFKLRGAYNKMAQLEKEEQQKGVITASAGNHAQGVALASEKLGISATIVMPKTTPDIKVASVREKGVKVVLFGDTFDHAQAHARRIEQEQELCFIHPYDDPDVIAGQGTIGMEILRQHRGSLDAIFVPVGGGGLIAGVSAYIKYLRPGIKIIGVEAEDSACLKKAMDANRRVTLPHVGIFADGVAVAQIGKETFKVIKNCVDEVITATTDEICAAIKDIFEDTRSICEPAGALALAGLKNYVAKHHITDQTLLAIDSGANVNFDRLRHISERSEIGEKREAILAVTIDERPGSFKTFCQALKDRNITEFNYRYNNPNTAEIFVGIQTSINDGGKQKLISSLKNQGYPVLDISNNEMAIIHIRHMVGGRSMGVTNEMVYRFAFPERPGALLHFLQTLGNRWNISMFHYRNHGAAYGRVLVGFQVPPNEKKEAREFLNQTGFRFWDETHNPAYNLFLSNVKMQPSSS